MPSWTLVLGLLGSGEAQACGGFFCDNSAPVSQAGERVVFAMNPAEGTVDAHVQIFYQGPPGDFAWIVPVPGVPELGVGSDAMFDLLTRVTSARFAVRETRVGDCLDSEVFDTPDVASGDEGDTAPDDDGAVGVTVVAQQVVGPYDSVILQGDSSEAVVGWLQGAGYQLPATVGAALAPYVASGQSFVALKLTADADAGEIVPLTMRYAATGMGVPIQLTSVAAVPDMPLEVFVLGDMRAVPSNYLHVTINEAAIDWYRFGANYRQVVSWAADEAAGQAFATDYTGPTAFMYGSLWRGQDAEVERLRELGDPIAWLAGVQALGIPRTAALLDTLIEVFPPPQSVLDRGVTPSGFYGCVSCFEGEIDASSFDPALATARLEERVILGLRRSEALLQAHPHLTRLVSALDAREMTVDPYFAFNADLPQDVPAQRVATSELACAPWPSFEPVESADATRRLHLPDGRTLRLPSRNALERSRQSELEALGDLVWPAALVIERYGAEGTGEVLFDYREQARLEAEDFGAPPQASGCGCAYGGGAGAGGALVAGLVALARRRRG